MLDTRPPESQLSFSLEAPPEPPAATDWRKQVPTVTALTRQLKEQLEKGFFDVWVRGQISGFKKNGASGHAYFCVKDAGAQLQVCFFKGPLSKIKFQIQDGMEVLIHGKITIYEPRGTYQLIADAMEPVGVGALQLAFEQLKLKLQKEGLFESKYKKRPPPFLSASGSSPPAQALPCEIF